MLASMQNTGPGLPNQCERQPFAHVTAQQQRVGPQIVSTSIYSGVHLHQTRLSCARPVGPFGPRIEGKGVGDLGRVLTSSDLMEPNELKRGCTWLFVPFLYPSK